MARLKSTIREVAKQNWKSGFCIFCTQEIPWLTSITNVAFVSIEMSGVDQSGVS